MSVEIRGFEDMEEELATLEERVGSIEGNRVPMTELFPPDFMATFTDSESIQAFFETSPWTVESEEDFDRIPAGAFDEYIEEHTGFDSWDVMLAAAGREWVTRQLSR